METKTRDEILLDEKIAKIDDINIDKIYGLDEVVNKSYESFTDENVTNIKNLTDETKERVMEEETQEQENSFSLEIQPNEFLDNMDWNAPEEQIEKEKVKLNNKPLFFAFTSIAVLLCILFVYNVFVIKSLQETTTASAQAEISVLAPENDYIEFENGNTVKIEKSVNYPNVSKKDFAQTNWFDAFVESINKMFGGNKLLNQE